ncbi:hypothetical protein [Nostoc sp.]
MITAILIQDNDLTQPWVLIQSGEEIFRANTNIKCHRHAAWKKIQIIE